MKLIKKFFLHNESIVNCQLSIVVQRGFTLIELIVVFSVMATLAAVSIVSFTAYNDNQTFQNAVSDVRASLATAKSRALSQVKPASCLNQELEGYQVAFTVPGQAYEIDALCGGQMYQVDKHSLPAQASFVTGSPTAITFSVLQGNVLQPGNITIKENSATHVISVDMAGNISVN